MQYRIPVSLLSSLLLIFGTFGNASGERRLAQDHDTDDSPRAELNESWDGEEDEDSWTWFGMGYESRTRGFASATPMSGGRKSDNN